MVNFKDFHKAYTSAYNPSLFSELDKKSKTKDTPRKPEEVEELIKFADTDNLFARTFSKSYKQSGKKSSVDNKNLFT